MVYFAQQMVCRLKAFPPFGPNATRFCKPKLGGNATAKTKDSAAKERKEVEEHPDGAYVLYEENEGFKRKKPCARCMWNPADRPKEMDDEVKINARHRNKSRNHF